MNDCNTQYALPRRTPASLTYYFPVLTRRDTRTLLKALRLWVTVLLCNLVSTWMFAAMLRIPGVFSTDVVDALHHVAGIAEGSQALGPIFVRSILAGWLIALMVWLLPSARSVRLLTVMLITYVVAVAPLSHVIAGSTEVAYACLAGDASLHDHLAYFLLPTLAGNIIGGTSLVAPLNHAAIAPEINGNR